MANSYNGHRSWNAWNVSLWINNDEGLYRQARALCMVNSRDVAAQLMLDDLNACGITKTPDGASYNKTCIREAMRGIL